MTRDQAEGILAPYYSAICCAVVEAYGKYRRYPSRTIHRKATRANIVNDEIIAKLVQEFDGQGGNVRLVPIPSKNLRLLQVGDRILLWFKKVDRLRRPRIFPTEHARLMESGRQMSMFPDCVLLVAGYRLNRDETKVAMVSIAKPRGRGAKPEWFIDIEPQEDGGLLVMPRSGGPSSAPSGFRIAVRREETQLGLL